MQFDMSLFGCNSFRPFGVSGHTRKGCFMISGT